jgi:short-chain fatty acids transporter
MNSLISRLGLAISRVFYRTCPDPFVIAIVLTVVTAILALTFGQFPAEAATLRERATVLLDAWRGESGLWKLLAFGMQMCLVLVTGHALASTRLARAAINAVADWPRSAAAASVLVCLVACITGLINWGLGLIVGALLARDVGRSLTRRGIPFHYPLLAASGYMGLLIFHGGLSASAPLTSTTPQAAAKVLSPAAVALLNGGVGLDRTLLSPLNLFVTGGMLLLMPVAFWLLTPRRPEEMQGLGSAVAIAAQRTEDSPARLEDEVALPDFQASKSSSLQVSLPDRLDRSPIIVWLLAVPLLIALVRYVAVTGLANLQLNEINAAMLALGLVLHGSPRAYMRAVEDGARDCAAIIIQFPIYAGIMALMQASGLVTRLAEGFAELGNANTLPALMFIAATIVGLFVPSGGAQWGLQGEIALSSGVANGIDPGTMIMSVAYGDELANMLQPFWALPLLAITGVRARDIVGYTAIIMVIVGAWMALGLLLFP